MGRTNGWAWRGRSSSSTCCCCFCSFSVRFRVGERLQSFEEVCNLVSSPFFSWLNAAALVSSLHFPAPRSDPTSDCFLPHPLHLLSGSLLMVTPDFYLTEQWPIWVRSSVWAPVFCWSWDHWAITPAPTIKTMSFIPKKSSNECWRLSLRWWAFCEVIRASGARLTCWQPGGCLGPFPIRNSETEVTAEEVAAATVRAVTKATITWHWSRSSHSASSSSS